MQSMMRILVAVAAISGQRQLMAEGLRLRWLMQQGATEDSVGLDINEVSAYIGQFVAGLQGSGAGGLSDQHIALLFEQVHLRIMSGESLLHMAASHGQYEISELLIDSGEPVNAKNLNGNTPLHVAVTSEDIPMVDLLLQSGADASAYNNDGVSVLQIAVHNQNLPIVSRLVAGYADANHVDGNGLSILWYAVSNNDFNSVKCLIEYHADTSFRRSDGMSLLMLALWNRHVGIIVYLLERGVTITAFDLTNMYAMGYLDNYPRVILNMIMYRPLRCNHRHIAGVSFFTSTLLQDHVFKSVKNHRFLIAAQHPVTLKSALARAVIYNAQGQINDEDFLHYWNILNLIIMPLFLRPQLQCRLHQLPTDISRHIVSMFFVKDITDKAIAWVKVKNPAVFPVKPPKAEGLEGTDPRPTQVRRLGC